MAQEENNKAIRNFKIVMIIVVAAVALVFLLNALGITSKY